MTLTHNSRIVAEPIFLGVSGAPAAGAYLLRFSLSLQVKEWPERQGLVLSLDRARLAVKGEDDSPVFLGFASPESTVLIRLSAHSYVSNCLFDCLLIPSAMVAIEAIRAGGDLEFSLKLQGHTTFEVESMPLADELSCRVNQKDWLRVLREVGFRDTLLFEVPLPKKGESYVARSAIEFLHRAREHPLSGHYDESVATCRRAIESLEAFLDATHDRRTAVVAYQTDKKSMTRSQRADLVREAIVHFSHPSHHGEFNSVEDDVSRHDATMALGVTAALFAHSLSDSATAWRQIAKATAGSQLAQPDDDSERS